MRRAVAAGLLLLVSACAPHIEDAPAPAVVAARFDPGRAPPVVPTPTDLAEDPATGLLTITPSPDASEADRAFVAYLNTLDGYPASATAVATFAGPLKPDTVTPASVRVLDLTAGNTPVEGITLTYEDTPQDAEARGRLSIKGSGGAWQQGHRYAVALIGGTSGLKGAGGEQVVGTAAWLLLRSEKPLVTCEDLTSPDCRATTDLIPSAEEDPAARLADQARTAVRLEAVRRHYAPTVKAFVDQGVARRDIALLWSFRVHSQAQVVFNPAATPARVPSPTDLAIDPATGLVAAPISPTASPAEQEFLRDYLNTLHGFPASSTAAVEIDGGDVDPATVTRETVRLYDLTAEAQGAPVDVAATLAWEPGRKRITLTPAGLGWTKGHTFAVAVVAGKDGGLRMTDGRIPVGSEVWAFLRGDAPLVTCEDLSAADCESAVHLAPISRQDALKLEGIRRGYAPLLQRLEGEGIPREAVAVLWTFTVVANPEATFDPAHSVVPFPNDIVRVAASAGAPAHLALPIAGSPSAQQLMAQLNTLDGFSTTATAVSENGADRAVLDLGTLPPQALESGAVGFLRLTDGPAPRVSIRLDDTLRASADATTGLQQLQFVPEVPLDEGTSYGGYLTTALKDAGGHDVIASAAFALARSSHPLVTEDGHSAVSVLSDAQARALEPVRQTLAPMLDRLAALGIPRKQVALAFSFTTQTTRATLQQLAARPQSAGVPTTVATLNNGLTQVLKGSAPLNQNPFPSSNVGQFYVSRLQLPDVLDPTTGGLDVTSTRTREVPFLLTTPAAAAPASGYPVVLFAHPITSSRLAALGLADKLAAAGYAMLAVDLPWHGERATCTGARDALALSGQDFNGDGVANDDDACSDGAVCRNGRCVAADGTGSSCTYSPIPLIVTLTGDAGCFARGEGLCLPDNTCEGGTFRENPDTAQPYISGWNYIGADFFANRAHLLQSVADVAQLVRVIQAQGTGSLSTQLGASKLDPASIHAVGMSLGGMTSALATSAVPAIRRVVLNAAGADLPGILVTGLTPEARAAFLSKVQASDPNLVPGTAGFAQLLDVLRIALDAGDAANQAPAMLSPEGGAGRQVLIQSIEADPIIPNANTQRLVASANRGEGGPVALEHMFTAPDTVTGADRHGFLVTGAYSSLAADDPLKQVCTAAQDQLVTFLTTGSVQ